MTLRYPILLIIIFLTMMIVGVLTRDRQELIYVDDTLQMTPVEDSFSPEIDKINAASRKIRSLRCSVDMTIQKNVSFRAHGSLHYQHDKNFRLIASRRTTELDVGSNDSLFWFWSRRMRPPNLYCCTHEGLTRSGLKTPFNPLWMMESMNIKGIDAKEAKVFQYGKNKMIRQLRVSSLNELVIKETLIDPERSLILGHYLYDQNKRIIASSEVTSFQNVQGHILPKSLRIIWHDEDVQMTWVLKAVSINVPINGSTWQPPPNKQRVNLGSS